MKTPPSQGLRAALLLTLLAGAGCRLRPEGQPLPLHAAAPPFEVASTAGTLDARAALATGPLVLVFYRGDW